MSKPLLGLGLVICLLGCKKNFGDFEQSYGTQDRTRREVHDYTYDNDGKILTDEQSTYYLLRDDITDTTRAISEYYYENGKLVKIITDKDIPELTFTKIFKYNAKDSLTLELWIKNNGDTIYISKADYDEQGNKILDWTRNLWNNRTLDDIINEPNKIVYILFLLGMNMISKQINSPKHVSKIRLEKLNLKLSSSMKMGKSQEPRHIIFLEL